MDKSNISRNNNTLPLQSSVFGDEIPFGKCK